MNANTFRNKFRNHISLEQKLERFNWFRVGGNAEILFEPEDENSLSNVLNHKPEECEIFTVGAGSNLLIRDAGIRGITIITKKMKKINIDNNGIITAQAGATDVDLARFARDHQRTGLEFLLGIPGTIGGGIRMNSGAFGSEFKDVLIDVKAMNHSGKFKVFSNKELKFEYRKISLSNKWIFCSARFKSKKSHKLDIEMKMKEIISLRKKAQPTGVRTGGSTFKNPKGQKAWQLIDKAGCRGLRIGDAMISEKHCNFIINLKKSSARQIEELGETVKERVLDNSGIELDWEIQRVGLK